VVERQKIAKLVDKLNHPSDEKRREFMRQLVEIGREAVDVLTANLRLAEPEVRPALIRVLGEIADDRALLPLMRFVFDTAGEPQESDARGFAMQAIMRIADESHADRLFDFLVDMKDDSDTFVRGYVIEAFGRLGNRQAIPFVRDALDDEADFVRECAQRALEALEDADSDDLESTLSGRELLQKIRISGGSELEYYMNELLGREDAFELAVQLIREDDRDTLRGLRALQRLEDPRSRQVALRQYETANSEAARAVCLRILGNQLEADATDEEVSLIERALNHSDPFIAMAALEAAGTSGDRRLMREALEVVEGTDLNRAETAAEGLARGLTPDNVRLLPDVIDAFEVIHRHRRDDDAPEYARIEAYLLRGIAGLVRDGGMGVSDAREAGLTALRGSEGARGATDVRPVLVSALRLIDQTLPENGLDAHERWTTPEAQPLLDLLSHSHDTVAGRTLSLVDRGVAGDTDGLSEALSRLIYEDPEVLLDRIIPLLERAGDQRAEELLDELTNHNDDEVQQAADAAVRRMRESGKTVDVEYE